MEIDNYLLFCRSVCNIPGYVICITPYFKSAYMTPAASGSFLKDRLFLLILLLIFVLLKIPHLDVPFYWDECWPYASAVRRMYDAGPSLLPGVIPSDYSRGHPLLFHFLAALWMKVFGTSQVAMHTFPLFLSVLGIAGVYEAALRLFNRNVAMVSALLLAFQVMFFVQASFVLPEVFLAFLGFFSIYFYARRRFGWTVLFLTALFYTKESGMVVGVVLGCDALVHLFRGKEPLRSRIGLVLSVTLPVLFIGLFFVLQKIILGWYVFPFHTGLIELAPRLVLTKIRGCFDVLFVHDLRQYILLLFIVLFIVTAIRHKSLKASLGLLRDLWCKGTPEQLRFIRLSFIFLPLFLLFTSVNMFIGRYLLIALLPVLFIGAILLVRYAEAGLGRKSIVVLLVLVGGIELMAFYKNKGHGDTDLGAFEGMKVHQAIVDYLEQHHYYHAPIATNAYLERIHLTDPYTGYLKGADTFSKVTWQITGATDIAPFDNIEPDYQYENVKADTSFLRVLRVERGTAWGEIYIRKSLLRNQEAVAR